MLQQFDCAILYITVAAKIMTVIDFPAIMSLLGLALQ